MTLAPAVLPLVNNPTPPLNSNPDDRAIAKWEAPVRSTPGTPIENARYARLPKRLRERYIYFRSQANQIALGDQIALAEALEEEVSAKLDGYGLSAETCEWMLTEMAVLKGQIESGESDPGDVHAALNKFTEAITGEPERVRVRDELLKIQAHIAKLKETEVKRMVAANQVLTVTESYNLIRRLVTFIEDHITDESDRARAVRELQMLLDRGSRPAPIPAQYHGAD
jgi:hypothetical protein